MGYILEFYSLNWSELQSLLRSGDESTIKATLEASERIFRGEPRADVDWKGALRDLITGSRGKQLAARGAEPLGLMPEEPSPAEALAIVAILRAHFNQTGEIIHTTRGGPKFRHMFNASFKPAIFNSMNLLELLLERPLFGLLSHGYPSWGGLKREEIAKLLGLRTLDNLPPIRDTDYEVWLYELCQVLLDVQSYQTDLITLYL
ncbi:MAG TPA: hypothetical protein VK619_17205 [Pyrinomonadaceae bacterium]|nr:hypothetical protein [Pyrinomonadaceae bacterium]